MLIPVSGYVAHLLVRNFGEYVCEDDVLSTTLERVTTGGFSLFRTFCIKK